MNGNPSGEKDLFIRMLLVRGEMTRSVPTRVFLMKNRMVLSIDFSASLMNSRFLVKCYSFDFFEKGSAVKILLKHLLGRHLVPK